jgi:hypothetical protein
VRIPADRRHVLVVDGQEIEVVETSPRPGRLPRRLATGPTVLDPTQRRRTHGDAAHGQRPGTVSIAGKYHSVGRRFAGRRITLRLEATLAHVVLDGVLTRTIPPTLSSTQRPPPGRSHAWSCSLLDQRPDREQRTVSCRGGTQIIGQRVQVGLRYAG